MTFKWQPPYLLDKGKVEENVRKTNQGLQQMATAHQTLDGTAIKSPALGGGFVVRSGSASVTGSQLGIATGLSRVDHLCGLAIDNGATATNFWVTGRVTPTNFAQIDIFCWQPTAAGNTTPIACTTPVVVKWWVTGTSTASQ